MNYKQNKKFPDAEVHNKNKCSYNTVVDIDIQTRGCVIREKQRKFVLNLNLQTEFYNMASLSQF